MLILGQTDVIRPQAVAELRRRLPGMRVAQWSVDALFEPGNTERLTRNLPVVDATLVTTAGDALAPLSRTGKRLGFLPNPVDHSIERGENHRKSELPFDLFYACGNPADLRDVGGRAWNMNDFARALMQALPSLRPCWVGLMGQPTLGGAAYQRAIEVLCARAQRQPAQRPVPVQLRPPGSSRGQRPCGPHRAVERL